MCGEAAGSAKRLGVRFTMGRSPLTASRSWTARFVSLLMRCMEEVAARPAPMLKENGWIDGVMGLGG